MSPTLRRFALVTQIAFALALTPACQRPGAAAHERDHAHGAEEEPEPLAITRWTAGHELFIELTPPRPGKPIAYHAHVTRLDGFKAVTEGAFKVHFKTPTGVAAEAGIQGVKRPGIFVFEAPAPAAGSYTLEMTYEHDGTSERFDGGTITVADPPAPATERSGAATTFLKESQWKIPFATAWAEEHPLAREIELAATVESAGTDQLTVGAPTGGRFFHNPKLALAEGGRIQKGDVLGWIAPTVAGDDYSRLVFAVDETRLTRAQTQREIARIEPLVQQSLLPEKRLIDLRNELDTLTTRLRSAEARLGRITTPGGDGVPIRSTIEGVIAQSLVANGAPVESGAPLVRIGGTAHVWIRARFAARAAASFADAVPVAARLPSGVRVDLEKPGARFLSTLPTVDPSSGLATWIVDVAPPVAARESELAAVKRPADLRPGAAVVLSVRIGAPRAVLAVPRSAVVEINTRPFVFLQLDGEHFEKRAVVSGDVDGGFIAVTSGISAGDRIVTTGGFDIHLASLMGTIESHRH